MSMERLLSSIDKSNRRLIGLMSGMSMDGVDLAFVEIKGVFPELVVQLLDTHYRPYNEATKAVLSSAREGTVRDVCQVNFLVAEEFANCVNDFLSHQPFKSDFHLLSPRRPEFLLSEIFVFAIWRRADRGHL